MLKVLYGMEHALFWREGYQSAPGHQFAAISISHLFNLHFPVIKIEEANLVVWALFSVLLPFCNAVVDSFGTLIKSN